jgi:gamma-glutamyltranspeptidase/glutathione hydrolase
MAPTIVFDNNGKFYAAIGSPGGSSIIAYVAKTIIGVVDWKLSMQDAINQPNVVANSDTIRIEAGKFPETIATTLRARGWTISPGGGEISGLNGIRMNGSALDGGSDTRREGVARLLAAGRVAQGDRENRTAGP